MKHLKYLSVLIILSLLSGCAKKDNTIYVEPVSCDSRQAAIENNFSISADSREQSILLLDTLSEKELASFEESFEISNLFLSMADENNGVLLSCSSPGCGQMQKQMYVTKDRWQTYDQIEISSLIDGYPTSLSAQSDTHFYIGAQMRSDGYLFETVDSGKTWNPIIIDTQIEHCRYGYAPIFNSRDNSAYVLLECSGLYSLYQSDAASAAWKPSGSFASEMEIKSFFPWNEKIIFTDYQDQPYQLSFRETRSSK